MAKRGVGLQIEFFIHNFWKEFGSEIKRDI
jgi:hypothetical protein